MGGRSGSSRGVYRPGTEARRDKRQPPRAPGNQVPPPPVPRHPELRPGAMCLEHRSGAEVWLSSKSTHMVLCGHGQDSCSWVIARSQVKGFRWRLGNPPKVAIVGRTPAPEPDQVPWPMGHWLFKPPTGFWPEKEEEGVGVVAGDRISKSATQETPVEGLGARGSEFCFGKISLCQWGN